jgi:hypothetical protein
MLLLSPSALTRTLPRLSPPRIAPIQALVSGYARTLSSCAAEGMPIFAPGTGSFASGIRGHIVGREKLIAPGEERASLQGTSRGDAGTAARRRQRPDRQHRGHAHGGAWHCRPRRGGRPVSGRVRAHGGSVAQPHDCLPETSVVPRRCRPKPAFYLPTMCCRSRSFSVQKYSISSTFGLYR